MQIPRRPVMPPDISNDELDLMERMVFVHSDPRPSDLLFVFGYTAHDWSQVADMYHAKMAPLVLATGLYGETSAVKERPQAHVIRDDLLERSVPLSSIIVEDASTNTLENVTFGKRLLDARGISPERILFMSKSHHGGRCHRTLSKYFPDASLSCFCVDWPYEGVMVAKKNWREHPVSRERVYGEYLRILKYGEAGDIAR